MLVGLKNSQTTFISFMDDILYNFTNYFMLVYLDEYPHIRQELGITLAENLIGPSNSMKTQSIC
jgi:hypothetical protein